MEKGYLERGSEGWRLVEYVNEVAFIPNSFVSVSSGYSPLCRLVTHGELEPLLLAAELYQVQDLMEERGVPLSVLRAYYYAYGETRIGEGHRLHRLWPGRPDPETGKKRKESYTQSQHRKWRTRNFWENLEALKGRSPVPASPKLLASFRDCRRKGTSGTPYQRISMTVQVRLNERSNLIADGSFRAAHGWPRWRATAR